MKAKKIIALTMSAAMAIGTVSLLAACKDEPTGGKPAVTVDNEVYHCAGTSKGSDAALYEQGWNEKEAGATEKVTFVKDTAITDENVFKLEMKIYAGDEFKIVKATTGWTWELTTAAFVGAQEDSTYGTVVKNDADEIVFRSVSSSNSNITVNEGMDGIYELTLKTNPGAEEFADQYKITYKLVEKCDKLRVPYNMEVKGDFNKFGGSGYEIPMTNKDGVWSTVIDITEDDLVRDETGAKFGTDYEGVKYAAAYVANVGDGEVDGDPLTFVSDGETIKKATIKVFGEDVEVNLLTAGKYTFTFDQETKTVTISEIKDDWNVVVGTTETKVEAQTDGTWTATITLDEAATGVKLVNKSNNKEVAIGDLAAGKYYIQYNSETEEVICDTNHFYVVGTINGWNVKYQIGTPVLTPSETEGVYEITVDWSDIEDEYVTFKIVHGNFLTGNVAFEGTEDKNGWYGHWQGSQGTTGDNDGENFKLAKGKYKLTIDMNNYGKIAYELIEDEAE